MQVVGKVDNHLDGMLGQLVVIVAILVHMAYPQIALMTALGGILHHPFLAGCRQTHPTPTGYLPERSDRSAEKTDIPSRRTAYG